MLPLSGYGWVEMRSTNCRNCSALPWSTRRSEMLIKPTLYLSRGTKLFNSFWFDCHPLTVLRAWSMIFVEITFSPGRCLFNMKATLSQLSSPSDKIIWVVDSPSSSPSINFSTDSLLKQSDMQLNNSVSFHAYMGRRSCPLGSFAMLAARSSIISLPIGINWCRKSFDLVISFSIILLK